MIDNDSLLVAKNLSKFYYKTKALNNLNFSLPKGITALIGPNGAGKTTFLKLVLGQIKPSAGSLEIFGFDSWKNSGLIHEFIGIVHEKHFIPGQLTIQRYLDIVSFFFENDDRLIDLSNILNFSLNLQIKSLSAGMFRRFCLFLCFLGKPKLILMDEPTANLDPIARKEFLDNIKEIHDKFGIDFVISSHILSDLESIASNVIVLNKGEIKFQGKFTILLDKYFSNQFELYVDDSKEWLKFLNTIDLIRSVKDLDNKIIFTTKEKIDSNKLLKIFLTSNDCPKSNINLFRKILDIEEIFN